MKKLLSVFLSLALICSIIYIPEAAYAADFTSSIWFDAEYKDGSLADKYGAHMIDYSDPSNRFTEDSFPRIAIEDVTDDDGNSFKAAKFRGAGLEYLHSKSSGEDWVADPGFENLNKDFTMEIYLKINNTGWGMAAGTWYENSATTAGWALQMGYNSAIAGGIGYANLISLIDGSGNGLSPSTVHSSLKGVKARNKWLHVVLVNTAGKNTLYINGQSVGTEDAIVPEYACMSHQINSGFRVGGYRPATNQFCLDMDCAYVRLYSKPATATDVAALYSNKTGAAPSGSAPTSAPADNPTQAPVDNPTQAPEGQPTNAPSIYPTQPPKSFPEYGPSAPTPYVSLPDESYVFGKYEQYDERLDPTFDCGCPNPEATPSVPNEKDDIEWIVLDENIEENYMLVTSKYGLESKAYNTAYENVTWETSTLRKWLNEDFINEAFNAEEQSRIFGVELTNSGNAMYGTNGGNDTVDRAFLFSAEELDFYSQFNPSLYSLMPTDAAIEHNAMMTGIDTCVWWLRTPGIYQSLAAYAYEYGISAGNDLVSAVNNERNVVRPVMMIELEPEFITAVNQKKVYKQGEAFDRDQLVVIEKQLNGDTRQVYEYQIEGFDPNAVGEQIVTVIYAHNYAYFKVTVEGEPEPAPTPTPEPAPVPTEKPTEAPADKPTQAPPTEKPSPAPTKEPTPAPTATPSPSPKPTLNPTTFDAGIVPLAGVVLSTLVLTKRRKNKE